VKIPVLYMPSWYAAFRALQALPGALEWTYFISKPEAVKHLPVHQRWNFGRGLQNDVHSTELLPHRNMPANGALVIIFLNV